MSPKNFSPMPAADSGEPGDPDEERTAGLCVPPLTIMFLTQKTPRISRPRSFLHVLINEPFPSKPSSWRVCRSKRRCRRAAPDGKRHAPAGYAGLFSSAASSHSLAAAPHGLDKARLVRLMVSLRTLRSRGCIVGVRIAMCSCALQHIVLDGV